MKNFYVLKDRSQFLDESGPILSESDIRKHDLFFSETRLEREATNGVDRASI
jgi:hypothetical protein